MRDCRDTDDIDRGGALRGDERYAVQDERDDGDKYDDGECGDSVEMKQMPADVE